MARDAGRVAVETGCLASAERVCWNATTDESHNGAAKGRSHSTVSINEGHGSGERCQANGKRTDDGRRGAGKARPNV